MILRQVEIPTPGLRDKERLRRQSRTLYCGTGGSQLITETPPMSILRRASWPALRERFAIEENEQSGVVLATIL